MCTFEDLFVGYHLEYISWVESSVNKRTRLNCVLFLHHVADQYLRHATNPGFTTTIHLHVISIHHPERKWKQTHLKSLFYAFACPHMNSPEDTLNVLICTSVIFLIIRSKYITLLYWSQENDFMYNNKMILLNTRWPLSFEMCHSYFFNRFVTGREYYLLQ